MREVTRAFHLYTNVVLLLCVLRVTCADGIHILNVTEDFSKIAKDPQLHKYVAFILRKIASFKLPMHPRISLFYELLKKKVAEYAQQTSDSLYDPHVYMAEEPVRRTGQSGQGRGHDAGQGQRIEQGTMQESGLKIEQGTGQESVQGIKQRIGQGSGQSIEQGTGQGSGQRIEQETGHGSGKNGDQGTGHGSGQKIEQVTGQASGHENDQGNKVADRVDRRHCRGLGKACPGTVQEIGQNFGDEFEYR